jgi:hypothetical protein
MDTYDFNKCITDTDKMRPIRIHFLKETQQFSKDKKHNSFIQNENNTFNSVMSDRTKKWYFVESMLTDEQQEVLQCS